MPTKDALQLRNWALTAEDAMLSLEEIACRVLNPKENVKTDAARERSPTSPMLCEEKSRLAGEHQAAALVYSRAIIALTRKRAVSATSEYERLRLAADDASAKCKEARFAFDRHMAEHGC